MAAYLDKALSHLILPLTLRTTYYNPILNIRTDPRELNAIPQEFKEGYLVPLSVFSPTTL